MIEEVARALRVVRLRWGHVRAEEPCPSPYERDLARAVLGAVLAYIEGEEPDRAQGGEG